MNNKTENIIAFGAENKTAFSVISKGVLYTGDPVANLNDINNFDLYVAGIKGYLSKNNIEPDRIACDMHPDYRSTVLAQDICERSDRALMVKVQHHHAHIVSCMVDNGLDEEAIGVSFDGTGYGSDGKSWGGEFLLCSSGKFSREYHLKYVPQPGGDIASREAWRMALAYLFQVYGDDFDEMDTPLLHRVDKNKVAVIKQMIKKDINCPETSSMGRLFDAVAAITGVCDRSEFEAEAAIALEQEAKEGVMDLYGYSVAFGEIDCSEMIRGIVSDIAEGVTKDIISAKFHNTIGAMIFDVSERISKDSGIKKVLISGGCFMNKYLCNYIDERFKGSTLELYKHKKYSPTDLGISVGQAVIAASENTND